MERKRMLASGLPGALAAAMLLGSSVAVADPTPPLTGETLAASTVVYSPATPVGGLPFDCSPGTHSLSFSFAGTATGPYSGSFTEKGTITYTLAPVPLTGHRLTGPVTQFSARFAIGSAVGWQRLSGTSQAVCDGGAGGEVFNWSDLTTTYKFRGDRGVASIVLASVASFAPNGSWLNATFSSTR